VSPDDPHIQSFWRVLRSFTPVQRQQFLRFVWARSRLPTSSSEFTQKFKIQAAVPEPVIVSDESGGQVMVEGGGGGGGGGGAPAAGATTTTTATQSQAGGNAGQSDEVEGLPSARRRPSSSRSAMRTARRSFTGRAAVAPALAGADGAPLASARGAGVVDGIALGTQDVLSRPDIYLPKAHTCFFSLNLPRYSSDKVRWRVCFAVVLCDRAAHECVGVSEQVMKDKLLYAIYNCQEMDGDYRLTENEMTGWD
jgi:hypothetical protein